MAKTILRQIPFHLRPHLRGTAQKQRGEDYFDGAAEEAGRLEGREAGKGVYFDFS